MKKRNLPSVFYFTLWCLALSMPARAHHSALIYDFLHPKTVTGIVKVMYFANPHVELTLEIRDAKGKRDIKFEGHGVNLFIKSGYRPELVKYGDTLEVTIAPRKDSTDGGYITAIKTADGRSF